MLNYIALYCIGLSCVVDDDVDCEADGVGDRGGDAGGDVRRL